MTLQRRPHLENSLFPELLTTVRDLVLRFDQIPVSRKLILARLSQYVKLKVMEEKDVKLTFICTHNSRRSHFAQIMAQLGAHYCNLPGVACYSGGTSATAVNPKTLKAIFDYGFHVKLIKERNNPVYEVRFSAQAPPVTTFSKTNDDPINPRQDFAAIMTCSHADANCPLVIGADLRIALTYDDPKEFDGTPHETARYRESLRQIGSEMLFLFSGEQSIH